LAAASADRFCFVELQYSGYRKRCWFVLILLCRFIYFVSVAAASTVAKLRARTKQIYNEVLDDPKNTKILRNVRLNWRGCNTTTTSCGSLCVQCDKIFTSHIFTSKIYF
jgi:hypothetical protein